MSGQTGMVNNLPPVGRTFTHLLVNTAVAGLTTSFLWFALTFWAYLETRSVLATGVIGGAYMLFVSASSIVFGSVVDHHRKITVMRLSSVTTLVLFVVAAVFYHRVPGAALTDLQQPWFWMLAVLILIGSVVEHMRNIALSTCVTIWCRRPSGHAPTDWSARPRGSPSSRPACSPDWPSGTSAWAGPWWSPAPPWASGWSTC